MRDISEIANVPRVPACLLPAGYRFALLPAPPGLDKANTWQDIGRRKGAPKYQRFAAKYSYYVIIFLIFTVRQGLRLNVTILTWNFFLDVRTTLIDNDQLGAHVT